MPCELLITNVAKAPYERGDIVEIKDTPYTWGTKETLPNWVRIRLTNATRSLVEGFLDVWYDGIFSVQLISEISSEYQVRVSKDATLTGPGQNTQIYVEVLDHLQDRWGITLISHEGTSVVLRVPKPADITLIKRDLADRFKIRHRNRRFALSSADMDALVAAGGYMEFTRQQAAARIIDRLK